ncbi:MAG TPA: 30S ribosomal protein S17 [Candidatus Absconditabacterales bacterium]|nr:30S ribosomal protein S17 [Candidatus Absconditabacterales bacterium]HNG96745.1 30S ribosomal protein S17 [Candidatus Absconditabacterales bacterium]
MITKEGKNIKELTGTVISAKADKTLVVEVKRVTMHPLYKKRFTVKKKYYVHDENNVHKEGDVVTFLQTRPLSKLKRWIVK